MNKITAKPGNVRIVGLCLFSELLYMPFGNEVIDESLYKVFVLWANSPNSRNCFSKLLVGQLGVDSFILASHHQETNLVLASR